MRRGVAGKKEEAAANAEAGSAIVETGILCDRWEPGDTLSIALCFVEGVGAIE